MNSPNGSVSIDVQKVLSGILSASVIGMFVWGMGVNASITQLDGRTDAALALARENKSDIDSNEDKLATGNTEIAVLLVQLKAIEKKVSEVADRLSRSRP